MHVCFLVFPIDRVWFSPQDLQGKGYMRGYEDIQRKKEKVWLHLQVNEIDQVFMHVALGEGGLTMHAAGAGWRHAMSGTFRRMIRHLMKLLHHHLVSSPHHSPDAN